MLNITETSFNFAHDGKPVATCNPGETILFTTLDCFSNDIKTEEDLVINIDFSRANPATGPVFIEGAEPGDILVVDILDIKTASSGCTTTLPGIGPLRDVVETRTRILPVENGKIKFNGLEFDARPMIGVIGTAPATGSIPSGHPGDHGGNMDCNLIVKGTRLFLPVRVKGALLAMGDIHAAMADGELCGTGVEVPGEITVKTELIKNVELNWPALEANNGKFYIIASALEYADALKAASVEMARLLSKAYGWDITDCFIYLSLQGDVEVCQACKPVDLELIIRMGVPKRVDFPLL